MDWNWLDVISRWAHIGTAIVLLGGAVFSRFVLLPSAAELPEAEHERLRTGVIGRWKRFVHIGIALLLISGFYNFFRAIPGHKGQAAYHAVIGIKILLALAIFFLASALVGRSSMSAALRKNARLWMGLIVLLGAIIVALSGYAKVALRGVSVAPAATADHGFGGEETDPTVAGSSGDDGQFVPTVHM